MQTKIHVQAASPREYVTGSTKFDAICHHCGRPMSVRRKILRLPLVRWLLGFAFISEFAGLSLPRDESASHCREDAHSQPRFVRLLVPLGLLVLVISASIAGVGIDILTRCFQGLPSADVSGLAIGPAEVIRDPGTESLDPAFCYWPPYLLVVGQLGEGVVGYGVFGSLLGLLIIFTAVRLRRAVLRGQISTARPPLPLFPRADEASVTEELAGFIELDASGEYRSSVDQYTGVVRPGLTFSSDDREQIGLYRQHFDLASGDDIEFDAGFILLPDSPRIEMQLGQGSAEASESPYYPNLIHLRGYIRDIWDLLEATDDENQPWHLSLPYRAWLGGEWLPEEADASEDEGALPIRLAAALERESGQDWLALEIQIPELELADNPIVQVETLSLLTSFEDLGNPASVYPAGLVNQQPDATELLWENVPWTRAQLSRRRKLFWVRLEDTGQFERAMLRGELVLLLSPALSGMRRIVQFNALGNLQRRSGIMSFFQPVLSGTGLVVGQSSRAAASLLDWTSSTIREAGDNLGIGPGRRSLEQLADEARTPRTTDAQEGSTRMVHRFDDVVSRSVSDSLANFVEEVEARRADPRLGYIEQVYPNDIPARIVTRIQIQFQLALTHRLENIRVISPEPGTHLVSKKASLSSAVSDEGPIELVLDDAQLDWRKFANLQSSAGHDSPVIMALPGVIPDHRLVGLIVQNIAKASGYHISELIENSPRISRTDSTTGKRLWNIVGRNYYGESIYPIDFHLVITGEEHYKGNDSALEGTSSIMVTVQGNSSDPYGEEAAEQDDSDWQRIIGTKKQLDSIIFETVNQWRAQYRESK